MYFPFGWPRTLRKSGGGSPLKYVACNRYRMLFALLTDETISIWHCRPCVEILTYRRGKKSISETGMNALTEWRHDSSMLAVATTHGYLLIYQLEQDVKAEKGITLFEHSQKKAPQGESGDGVPALRLCLKTTIEYRSPIVSLSCVSDELLIATSSGELELIPWYGPIDSRKLINVQDMTFSVDLHSTGTTLRSKHPIHVLQVTYSPCLEGFTAVLSDGRAALIFITKSVLNEKTKSFVWKAHGIWANGLSKAVCSAVNNRYRLMAFGTSRGSCEVYSMDDVLGCLQFSHQMILSPKYYPDVYKNTGAVLDMQWTPDGCALSLSWHHGGLSVWSVYGSCLYCTLSADHAYTASGVRKLQSLFHSMCWGAEGYQLWVIQESKVPKKTTSNAPCTSVNHNQNFCDKCEVSNSQSNASSSSDENFVPRTSHAKPDANHSKNSLACDREFIQVQFAKSSLTMNPCTGNQSHVIIQAEDRLYISFGENRYTSLLSTSMYDEKKKKYVTKTFIEPGSPGRSFESIVGNKQWTVIQLPTNYLNGNWPIRFASIDKTGKLLAVAGNFGLAHYSFITRKWKLFGNIMHEKDMVVTGGLTWWDGLIIVACYNLLESHDEIRIYPHNTNLDNVYSYVKRVSSQILLINVYLDIVIIFDATCHIKIYQIKKEDKIEYTSASLTLLKDISMQRFVPYPSLVVSVMMAALHLESANRKHTMPNQKETEVLIINVAGRLLLLQHQQDESLGPNAPKQSGKDLNFVAPIVLASQVENIWASEYKSTQKVHLTDALWLCCGSAGVRVWLPLFPPLRRSRSGDAGEHDVQALLSKRIMLTLEMDSCYPLTVLFENAVVIGVKTETSYSDPSEADEGNTQYCFPFSTLERTCEMYLHQILRHLLRRNLGYHALQIALSCRSLSYFPHVLELMLHKVLEEEATASAPIPDPLLPTIVKFIMEFPEYLETIVHCARKTEIALWQYLFNSVGSPKELFEECLEANRLETAASYLIILQNLEKLTLARQDATRLLSRALAAGKWQLASDIIRFLRAIGDGDQSTAPRHPQLLNTNIYPAVAPPLQSIEENAFSDNKIDRDTTGKQSDLTVRHSRRFSNYYELYPQKSTQKPPQSPSPDSSSSSYHPYVPHYPLSSYPRHRPLQASLSHPPSTDSPPSLARSEVNKLSPIDEQNILPECAEHYFIDVILSRQARSLLSKKDLFQLATFAAYLEFDLLPWLQKERTRVARVSDAAECLAAVHSSFNWPYPSIVKVDTSPRRSSSGQRSGMSKARSMDTLSQASISTSDMFGSLSISENAMKNTPEKFEMSDTSSINEDLSNSVLDVLYENYKVDRRSESALTRQQISQVFDLMLNARCLEWALVLALVLHDIEKLCQILSVVRSDKSPELKLETLQRTRESATQIKKWAAMHCVPYEKVLFSMEEQLIALDDLVNEREIEYAEQQAVLAQQQSQMSSPETTERKIPRSRHTSKEEVAKKEEAAKDNSPEDVSSEASDVTDIPSKEERTRHISASRDDESDSETDSEEISEEEAEEGCAIS